MAAPNLLLVCGIAFVVVFALLAVLSGLMVLLLRIFPARRPAVGAVEVAVISTATATLLPGSRVVHIEELQ